MEIIIVKAEYLADHKIEISFQDGKKQIVDFGPFITTSNNPEIKKYLNVELFKLFTVVDGDLNWNDYDLIFPIYDLYTNKISIYSEDAA